MRIAFGTDDETTVTAQMREHMTNAGHHVFDVAGGEAWPEVGRAVGVAVANGEADRGVVCCYTGTGVSIAANKVAGVRAALCTDSVTAAGARRWNDANVLAMGLHLVTGAVAAEMIDVFLATDVDREELSAISRVEPLN
jgi:ribose 5-phosphate isomerase B